MYMIGKACEEHNAYEGTAFEELISRLFEEEEMYITGKACEEHTAYEGTAFEELRSPKCATDELDYNHNVVSRVTLRRSRCI